MVGSLPRLGGGRLKEQRAMLNNKYVFKGNMRM